MTNVLRLALVDPDDGSRENLKKLLLGMDTIWLEAECSRYEFFPDVVSQSAPDVGMVTLDGDEEKALALLARMRREAPGLRTACRKHKYRWPADSEVNPSGSKRVSHAADVYRRSDVRFGAHI